VSVRQRSGEFYTTEFVSCVACGVMYHRPDRVKQIEPLTPERSNYLKRIGRLK
jgi:hypothetical protein